MRKHIISILAALLLLRCLPVTVLAHAVPEETRKGSITVTMRIGDTVVSGGSLTLYRVGEVHEDDGNYSFVPTGDFTDCGVSLDNVQSPELAEKLAAYVNDHKPTGTTRTVGKDGKVTFSNLKLGLYLLVQTRAASGYSKISPFLVTVPYLDNGVYIYEVDADTKMELEKEPKPTAPPSTPHTGGKLPQTGQLNWPVPVLAILGMTLFTVGWVLRFRKRHGNAG